jgi:putative ABC transport system permease protein
MSQLDLIKRAVRGLKSAKLRTLLTALAISVGGFTLALTLSASNGVRDYTDDLVSNNFDPAELTVGRDPEIVNTGGGPSDIPQEYDATIGDVQVGDGGSLQIRQVTRDDIEILESYEEIEQVRPFYTIPMQYVTRDSEKQYTGSLQPYNPGQKPELIAGDLPAERDLDDGGVLLPDVYLELLGFESAESAVGQDITVSVTKEFSLSALTDLFSEGFENIDPNSLLSGDALPDQQQEFSYTVAGVTTKPATSFAFGILPIVVSGDDARELYEFSAEGSNDFDKFIYATVTVRGGENEEVRAAVKEKLENDDFYVLTSDDIQAALNQFVDILTGLVFALGMVTLIASVFGIVNTQYISVLERTREIGLMKALGMSRRGIRRLFTYEAAWIGVIGGLLGIVGAVIVGSLLNPLITDSLGIENSLIIFNPLQLIGLLLALMLVGIVAGLLPAIKAAKLDPVEALRTE